MSLCWSKRLAVSLIATTIAATWLLSGVAVSEALRFVAFEALYVLLPGCSLYLALSPRPGGRLRTVAIGWPLGYAVEVGAFALTASLHERGAFALLPLVSVPAIAVLAMRKRRSAPQDPSAGAPPRPTGVELAALAVAISAALTLLALASFTAAPLPGHVHSVEYYSESVYAISLAAEARHHWPITIPWVAGMPLHYYTAAFMHGAAINQVSGVALSTIYLRLLPTTATLLLALQLWSLGRAMGRSPVVGPLAVVLFFLVGSATLSPRQAWPLEGNSLGTFWGSATFTFAAPFLLALLSLVQHWLAGADARARGEPALLGAPRRSGPGTLIVLALLVLGCASAKAFAAVDFIGGLGLFLLWGFLRRRLTRRVLWLLACSMVISTACLAVIYAALLAGGGSGGRFVSIQPINPSFAESLYAQARSEAQSIAGHSALWVAALIGGVVVTAACLSAPVLGAIWLLLRRKALSSFEVFCLAVLLTGLACYSATYAHAEGAEIYFRFFGYFALVPIAAGGLAEFWRETPKQARQAVTGACGVVLALGLGIASAFYVFGSSSQIEHAWSPATYGLVAVVVAAMVLKLRRYYAPLVVSRLGSIVACCIALLGVLGLVRSGTLAALRAKNVILGRRIAPEDNYLAFGMTGALYQGLLWVRTHSDACEVLAVNNHYASPDRGPSTYLYYSAFTERRIFLESWEDTPSGVEGRVQDPGRLALNDSAVLRGDPVALRELGQDGVSYVLIDKTHGTGAHEPTSVSRLVFSNGALDVYRLRPQADPRQPGIGCDA